MSCKLLLWSSIQGRAQEFEKGGGRNFQFPFPLKISVETKKRFSRLSTSNLSPKSSEDLKKGSSRPQMSCFHCSADWKYISAYISAKGEEGCDPSAPPSPGYAPGIAEKHNTDNELAYDSYKVLK